MNVLATQRGSRSANYYGLSTGKLQVGDIVCTFVVLCSYEACITIGYVASYWNTAFYPEWCSNVDLDDTSIYNTVVRVSGAWAGIADALKQVLDYYGWHHTVFLSNERGRCYYGGVPIKDLLSTAENFTFYWINMAPVPTDDEIEDYLHQIRIRTRGRLQCRCGGEGAGGANTP